MKLLSLPPPSHIAKVFAPQTWDALRAEFQVIENREERRLSVGDIQSSVSDCQAILTGWGSPALGRDVLETAPGLKIVAHSAGSVKGLFSDVDVREVLMPRGIHVFSAAGAIALNVAETTIGLMIATTRRWTEQAAYFRENQRGKAAFALNAQTLTGATVGIVSASLVGRQVLRVLAPFGCRVLLYDPFVSSEAARGLGVEMVDLDALFERSDIVSVHAPKLPATYHMIGAAHLAKLRDGAAFINTSRGEVVDHDALLAECQSGRIVAALDVTEPEPLPQDSPFWELPNVLLLPHIAGSGRAGYFRIGDSTLQALRDARDGKPIAGAVRLERWDVLA